MQGAHAPSSPSAGRACLYPSPLAPTLDTTLEQKPLPAAPRPSRLAALPLCPALPPSLGYLATLPACAQSVPLGLSALHSCRHGRHTGSLQLPRRWSVRVACRGLRGHQFLPHGQRRHTDHPPVRNRQNRVVGPHPCQPCFGAPSAAQDRMGSQKAATALMLHSAARPPPAHQPPQPPASASAQPAAERGPSSL